VALDVTAACDFFVVRTATFKLFYVFVVLSHARRQILHVNVTEHPTAAWTARSTGIAGVWIRTSGQERLDLIRRSLLGRSKQPRIQQRITG
jgi:hypothetical protein